MPTTTKRSPKRSAAAKAVRVAPIRSTARQKLIYRLRREYTPEVCAETLRINAEFAAIARQ